MLQNTYKNWKTNHGGWNQFHDIDGKSYVSYLEKPGEKLENITGIKDIFASDEGQSETAFFDNKTNKFYILNGDFRLEYQTAIETAETPEAMLIACKKVYSDNIDKRSTWSEDEYISNEDKSTETSNPTG